jgi:hypothetical protein
MSNLEKIGNEKMPSILKNPFQKNCVTEIRVSYYEFMRKWSARGTVEFKNGLTKGEQKFEAETFDEVVIQIKNFLKELENELS